MWYFWNDIYASSCLHQLSALYFRKKVTMHVIAQVTILSNHSLISIHVILRREFSVRFNFVHVSPNISCYKCCNILPIY